MVLAAEFFQSKSKRLKGVKKVLTTVNYLLSNWHISLMISVGPAENSSGGVPVILPIVLLLLQ